MLLAEILYIAQDSAITNSPFGRQQTVHERDSLAVTDDVNCKDLREQRRRHFKCAIKVPIRVICQPTQPLVRSKHNGTIYFRNRVGSNRADLPLFLVREYAPALLFGQECHRARCFPFLRNSRPANTAKISVHQIPVHLLGSRSLPTRTPFSHGR